MFDPRLLLSAPALFVYALILSGIGLYFENVIRTDGATVLTHVIIPEDDEEIERNVESTLSVESADELTALLNAPLEEGVRRQDVSALPLFQQADDAGKAQILSYLGEVLSRRKRFDEAIILLSDLSGEDRAQYGSSFAYAQALGSVDRQFEALNAYEEHIRERPTHQAGYINYGLLLARMGRHEEALVILQRAAEITSGSRRGKALSLMGTSQMELGDYESAIASFDKSIEYRPTNGPTWRRLAVARSQVEAIPPEEVIQTFERAISIAPDSALAQKGWAQYYFSQGRFDEALPHFREATRLSDDNFDIQFSRALNLQASERPAATRTMLQSIRSENLSAEELRKVELLEAIVSLPDADIENHLNDWPNRRHTDQTAYLLILAGLQVDRAETAHSLLTGIAPDSFYRQPAEFALGRYAFRAGSLREAADTLGALVERNDHSPAFHLYLARTYQAIGENEAAFEAFQRAYVLFPNSRKVTLEYNQSLRGVGSDDTSVQILRAYLDYRPKDTRVMLALAEVYENQGAISEALRLYRQVFDLEPSDIDVGVKLTGAQVTAGKLSDALLTIDDLIEKQPAELGTRMLRVDILQLLERPDAVSEELQRVLKLDADHEDAARRLADMN